MTQTYRGPGRPKLTVEQAWESALARVEASITKTVPHPEGGECMFYSGSWKLEIADGKRTSTNPQKIIARALGKDIHSPDHRIVASCGHRRCVSPDHVRQIERWPVAEPTPVRKASDAFKAQLARAAEEPDYLPF